MKHGRFGGRRVWKEPLSLTVLPVTEGSGSLKGAEVPQGG